MKKIISLLLTVAMLMSMLGIVASAEGNAAVFYHGANNSSGNRFLDSYCYFDKDIDAVKRVNESGAQYYGGYNYTQVFDFKVTDYGTGSDHYTDFTFSNDIFGYHYGYSFTKKAFVVYTLYMPGSDPNAGSTMLASMSYDLQLDTWYEMAVRFVDKTITIYLNGVEMLVCDLNEAYAAVGNQKYIDDWNWTAKERPETLDNDLMMFHIIDVDMYMDNWAIYSGDYDIATGTASTTIAPMDSDFVNFNTDEDRSFSIFKHSDCGFSLAPNGGTDKVTYDRQAAATHAHEWTLSKEKSSTVHCLVPGYDLYECANGCGASEQRNYVNPLGHLPGYIDSVVIAAGDDNSGVEKRTCTREGCGKTYTTIVPLTGAGNNAIHMYTDGGTGVYNGQMGVTSGALIALEKGIYFEFDIMPISQTEGKDFAKIGGSFGGNEHDYWVGYEYNIGKYVIRHNDEIVAESDKAFKNFEWQNWGVRRSETKIEFFVDGELLLETDVDPDIYTLTRVDEDGEVSQKTLADCFSCGWSTPACESIIDNMLAAAPDFDLKTRSGLVYSYMNFNDDKYVDKSGYVYNKDHALQDLFIISYNSSAKAGAKVEPYGRPMQPITEAHQDRALLIDSNYENGSIYGYSQFGTDNFDMSKALENGVDIEFTYDFYVYDWCTDETILNKKATEANGMKGGSAFIGTHVNSQGVGSVNNPHGNGFAGYDFIKQAVVIGAVSEQAGGYYGDNSEFTSYAVEKETWHNMSITYKHVDEEDETYLVISVYMDGKLVASKKVESYWVNVDYVIFFPNFVKGYFDNITTKVNGITYDDNLDFTNAYSTVLNGMTFESGTDWSIADGGYPTHVYETSIYPASCETDGYTTYSCSCGKSDYVSYNIKATGHSWDEGVVTTPATGTSVGVLTYTCGTCKATKTEEIAKLFTYGDVNDSGVVDNTDLSLFKRFISGVKLANFNSSAADVNDDGIATNPDYTRLIRFVAGAKVTLGPAA